jgi:hypothetical protein
MDTDPADDLPPDPDDEQRESVQRQGNIMFWLTLGCGFAILVFAIVFAIVV